MISSDEQSRAEARDYVLNTPMVRPTTTVFAPIALILCVVAVGIAVGFVIAEIIGRHAVYGEISTLGVVIGVVVFLILCTVKPLLVLCIRCYQHYAPEILRRSCLCKPTCSEYAIIVIKRYCLVKALFLIYVRLFRTCTGKDYKIDFPYVPYKRD